MFEANDNNGNKVRAAITSKDQGPFLCTVCNEDLSYVSVGKRRVQLGTREISVRPHFRHKEKASHVVLRHTAETDDITSHLIDNFDWFEDGCFDVETDKVFNAGRLEFAVNLYVQDLVESKNTAIFVESTSFNGTELGDKVRYLSANGIRSMLILSSKNYFKDVSMGKYARDDLKSIKGNEKDVYDFFGRNFYFDHESELFLTVGFNDYADPLSNRDDPRNYCRRCPGKASEPEYLMGSYDDFCTSHWHSFGKWIKKGAIPYGTVKDPIIELEIKRFDLAYFKRMGTTLISRMKPVEQ
ncbi:hypothetical protein HN695_02905 [Candidatus Woesearchaeota archaeon]|nr:hypothetical protein [Candidatus Woesearchaeota archaeon]MBT5272140.1 hypothetical protein [Candidatus Woesearchaeota archaeon]MBT6040943.1 hypothetical protein [Candidatus Woesearchaeota archaeon]MBT6336277.1 hypothetical protein [Candidatus Woesearchaeota archaeon]MBT7927260.1 hypothetical protein [Candidatus Woesearchaeota archaeon]